MSLEFRVDIPGADRIAKKADRVALEIMKEVEKAVFLSAKKVEKEAKESILSGQKSGRVYRRGKTVLHRASAPGEAPASDTGRLVNSINTYFERATATALVIAGRGAVKYAAMLEFGTSKMLPRPFFQTALEKNRHWIRDRIAKAVVDGERRGTK